MRRFRGRAADGFEVKRSAAEERSRGAPIGGALESVGDSQHAGAVEDGASRKWLDAHRLMCAEACCTYVGSESC